MRKSILQNKFEAEGVAFSERYGVSVPTTSGNAETEYNYIREAAGITDFSFLNKFTIPEDDGIDFLNSVFAGDVESLRFGRVLNTFLADDEGNLLADVYIANNDEEFIVLCESLVSDEELHSILFDKNEGEKYGLTDITDSYSVISVDGFDSWSVCKDIFGVNILGLPYLSIEEFDYDDGDINIIRAGKTGEFGYLILIESDKAEELFDTVYSKVKEVNGGLCGLEIHNTCRLDGRFFNIYAEGAVVRNPLYLGLQWMIDLENIEFQGSEPIVSQREQGVDKKIVGVFFDESVSDIALGDKVYDEDGEVGELVAVQYSFHLKKTIALVLMKFEVAYATLTFYYGKPEGPVVSTISMPPFSPKSLSIKLN